MVWLAPKVGRLTINKYRGTEWLGRVTFDKIPIEAPWDFSCTPPNLMSFDDAEQLSERMACGFTRGEFGALDEYVWLKD